jgi:hypothetical protein
MCDKSVYREYPPEELPTAPADIYAEYLKRIEDFKKRME